jgi:hypothetical protein
MDLANSPKRKFVPLNGDFLRGIMHRRRQPGKGAILGREQWSARPRADVVRGQVSAAAADGPESEGSLVWPHAPRI